MHKALGFQSYMSVACLVCGREGRLGYTKLQQQNSLRGSSRWLEGFWFTDKLATGSLPDIEYPFLGLRWEAAKLFLSS